MTESSLWKNIAAIPLPGDKPRLFHQDDTVALISKGSVDLFLVPLIDEKATGQRTFVAHLESGSVLFYLAEELVKEGYGILMAGTIGTTLSFCSVDQFVEHASEQDLQNALLNWTTNAFSTLINKQQSPPSLSLSDGDQQNLSPGTVIHSDEALSWIAPGNYILMPEFLNINMELRAPFPLIRGLWLSTTEDSAENLQIAAKFTDSTDFSNLLLKLNELILSVLVQLRISSEQRDKARQSRRGINDRSQKYRALDRLSRAYSESISDSQLESEDSTVNAMQAVCNALNLPVKPVEDPKDNAVDHVQQLARGSSIPLRRVLLRGQWWEHEGEPMIAFLEEENHAVALLPDKKNRLLFFNPATNERTPVTSTIVQQLQGIAFMPYRSLPSGRVTGKDLVRFSLFGAKADLLRVLIFGLLGGVLAMAIPLATGIIFDQIIPASNRAQLIQIAIAICVVAVAAGVFQYLQGLSIVRLESRAAHALQSAVWDRITKLPVNFFANYSTGDLLQRAFGIDEIRQQISATVVRTVLSFLFSIFSFGLMFYYSLDLALWACFLVIIAIAFTLTTGLLTVPATRKQQEIEGSLTAFVLQCIEGVAKIRVTSSQERAFYQWAAPFSDKLNTMKVTQSLQTIDKVFASIFPLLCSMVIFYALVHNNSSITLTTGSFLAFNAAFINVLGNFLIISSSLVVVFRMLPVYERMMPIMDQAIEADTVTADPGTLNGELEVSNLQFRYTADGPQILSGVDLHIDPGEFVALVGTSGGGKSTLFRILLGFEIAEGGSISFDGKNITTLDKQALRRQIGVVLQSGNLMPGDIFTNIIGSANLSLDQAWDAARMAGFEDDIKSMPMGMNTVISEGGGGLSGGQKQRLQIARAFVHRPKILFFDEATSALDNRTQEIVTHSMNELCATRIVIAHRLSTVIDADRILVLNKGKIEESGTYSELMAKEGLFHSMASRQIA